ncbi:MAG: GNAT family N-acetyltransferase [Chitinophagaceae bacterium]|nr:GNAT family N-acetyltransferase [Chitinophagaceae bacterium]
MEAPFFIRELISTDIPEASALITENAQHTLATVYSETQMQAFLSYYTEKALEEKMTSADFFCAMIDDEIVGMIGLEDNMVIGFYTKVSYLGRGIGKILLNYIENFAQQKGYINIQLASSPISISFYEKQGWLPIKKIYPTYCGVIFEELLMKKDLTAI